jgi:glycosyltransferase involved in cell wall biosynthesis
VRLCIASGTFHPEIGGPPTYLYALASDLVRLDHRLHVVTYGDRDPPGAYPYPVYRVPRQGAEPQRVASFTLATIRAARRAELLYVNDYGLPPAIANLALRKPTVLKVVGDFAWEYTTRHRLIPTGTTIDQFQRQTFGWRAERIRRLQNWYARRADLVIAPSQYLAHLVVGWGVDRDRVRIVYNAPVPEPAPPPRNTTRRELGLNDGDFVVITIARLAPWKGVDVLIQALAMARERLPRVRLLIVGEGETRGRLEELARPLGTSVTFTGQVTHKRALALLQAADALALVSSYEGLSHVLLEAMQARVPIVASAVGGNRELIRDGENGLLVPYGRPEPLAEAIIRFAEDPALRGALSEAAGTEADSRAWARLVEATLDVFHEALGARRQNLNPQ